MKLKEALSKLRVDENYMHRLSCPEDETIILSIEREDNVPQLFQTHEIEPGSDELCACLIEEDEISQMDEDVDDWIVADFDKDY